MYYLETNALITLNNEISIYKQNSFTSAFSIFELISGLNNKNFNIRKKALQNIYSCKLPIVWFLPESITATAFSYRGIKYQDFRAVGLKKLSLELMNSNNLDSFETKTNPEKYNLTFFKELDIYYSTRFIDSTINLNNKLKQIIEDERNTNGDLLGEFGKEFIKNLPNDLAINHSMTINAIVENIANGAELATGKIVNREQLYNSYNHSIDTFVEAFTLFASQKSSEFKHPAENDFFDLHHLLYLGNNPRYFIITNDKMVSKITKKVISIENFKKK